MRKVYSAIAAGLVASAAASAASAATANWDAYVIRQVPGSLTPVLPIENLAGDGVSVLINEGNEKAGYGTSYFDGMPLTSVGGVSYSRDDFGTGEIYSNIWISDGTNYAVIAPAIGMNSTGNYTGGSNINGVDIQDLGFNIHEFVGTNFDWIVPGAKRVNSALLNADNSVITVSDLGHLFVDDPNPSIAQGGGGAPKNGTGFNLIFGDTANNHTNGVTPYMISGAQVSVVPEPASLGLLGLGGVALLGRRRRKTA